MGVWKDVTTRTITAFDMLEPRLGLAAGAGPARLLFKIDNDREFGILTPIGDVTSIVIRNKDVAYMSVAGDGIYKSSADWQFWERIFEGANTKFLSFIGAKLFIRSGNRLLYSTTGTGFTECLGIDTADRIESVAGYGDRLAAVSKRSLYRSTNGGAQWIKVMDTLAIGGTLYADTTIHALFAGANNLLISRDSGRTWKAVPTILISSSGAVYGTRDCSGVFYIGPDLRTNRPEMLRSIDHGKSLQVIDVFVPQKIAKFVVLDRGSTVYWLDSVGVLRMNRDGIDGYIKDSVASKVTVRADTGITAFACPGAGSKPFSIYVGFPECTGIKIDNVVFEGNASFTTNFTSVNVASGEVSVAAAYKPTEVGYDSARIKITFRSLIVNQTEVAYGKVVAHAVTQKAQLGVSTELLAYGIVDTSLDSARSLVVRNTGCDALHIDSVLSSLPDIFSITDAGGFPKEVKGGALVTFTVKFAPKEKREYVESIELYTSEGTRYITLQGVGTFVDTTVASVDDREEEIFFQVSADLASGRIGLYSVKPITVKIYDVAMRFLQSIAVQPYKREEVDLHEIPSGLYFFVAGDRVIPAYIVR